MLLHKILKGINCNNSDITDMDIEHITAKVNDIKEKTLFILYKSLKFDYMSLLNEIIEKKPSAILTDQDININSDIPIISVENCRLAYSYAMYNFCEIPTDRIKIYAVTGSNGKTTTATILYKIFRKAKIKCGFIGTGKIIINDTLLTEEYYSMTTPDPDVLYPCIKRMQSEGCTKIVMEVSSHALALYKVVPLKFECAMFTNLSSEHLDFHGNIENYFNAKCSIFNQSKNGIFNMDDEYVRKAYIQSYPNLTKYSVAIKNSAEAMAKEIDFHSFQACSYIYRESHTIFKINLNLGGEYNISNSLLAIKCALISGIDIRTIKEGLEEITLDGRGEKVCDSPTIIIDYAHTDEALQTILNFIKTNKKPEQRLFSLFGCGGDRDKDKRPRMARISEKYSDYTIITSDNSRSENPKEILNQIEKGFINSANYSVIENRDDAIKEVILKARDNDIILIIGKGHERYNIDSSGYHPFDERIIIKKALEERKIWQNENKN